METKKSQLIDICDFSEFLDSLVESYGSFGLKTGKKLELKTGEEGLAGIVMRQGWSRLLTRLLIKASHDLECDKITLNCVAGGLNIHFSNWTGQAEKVFSDKRFFFNAKFLEETYQEGRFHWEMAIYHHKSSERTLVFKLRFS